MEGFREFLDKQKQKSMEFKYERVEEIFDPLEYGWVSATTPPESPKSVVVLIWYAKRKSLQGVIGHYYEGEWDIDNVKADAEFQVMGWFPFPFVP